MQLDIYMANHAEEKFRKEIEKHLETCDSCSKQVKEMTHLKRLLTPSPGESEGPHPDIEEIEEFYYNRLDEEKTDKVLNHLGRCYDCKENLDIIRTKERLIEEGELAPEKIPTKLPPELEDYVNKLNKK